MKKIAAILVAVCLFSMSVSVRAGRIVGGENPDLADGALDIPAEAGPMWQAVMPLMLLSLT